MEFFQLVAFIAVIVIGLILINKYLPLNAKIKAGIIIVIIIIVMIWLLQLMFDSTGLKDVKI